MSINFKQLEYSEQARFRKADTLDLEAPFVTNWDAFRWFERATLNVMTLARMLLSRLLPQLIQESDGGCEDVVDEEMQRLRCAWKQDTTDSDDALTRLLGTSKRNDIDLFDRVQLQTVITTCRTSKSMADAGRKLFAATIRRWREMIAAPRD